MVFFFLFLEGERDFSRREMVSGLCVFEPSVRSCWQCSLLEEGGTVAKGPRQELGFCFPCLITKNRDMMILKDLLSDFCAISEMIFKIALLQNMQNLTSFQRFMEKQQ